MERERERDSRRRFRLLSRDLERFRARSFSRERDRDRLRFFLLCLELLVCLERDELRLRDRPIPAEERRKGRAGDRPTAPAPSSLAAPERGARRLCAHQRRPGGPLVLSLYHHSAPRGEGAGPESGSKSGRRQDGGPSRAVTLLFRPTMHCAAPVPFAPPSPPRRRSGETRKHSETFDNQWQSVARGGKPGRQRSYSAHARTAHLERKCRCWRRRSGEVVWGPGERLRAPGFWGGQPVSPVTGVPSRGFVVAAPVARWRCGVGRASARAR